MRDNSDASTTSRGSEPRPKRRGWARNNYYLESYREGCLKTFASKAPNPLGQCLLMVLKFGSYTKKQISKMLKWVVPYLPEEKPRHLLGVGKVVDIFEAVQNGVDTFDCVIPTREARHGRLYTKTGHMDIRKGVYFNDKKVIEKSCGCLTCSKKISRSKIRGLIKSDNTKLNAEDRKSV